MTSTEQHRTMNIHFDKTSTNTKQQQAIDGILTAIKKGELKAGDPLPSVNHLSTQLGVSRDTIFKAYRELRLRGAVESTPTKGYFVAAPGNKVLMFLDSYSPFKDALYNSFVDRLPEGYYVDLAFHHYNIRVFESVIRDSIGRYDFFVVMNFNNEGISGVLRKIDRQKLLILDWGDFKHEKYSYVCQDFGQAAYRCFNELQSRFIHYNRLGYVTLADCPHPVITRQYFERFCSEIDKPFDFCNHIDNDTLQANCAYIVFRQKELVELLKMARRKGFLPGRDFGLVAYNDNPLYEVIGDGITTISTDFTLMGQRAAWFVTTREPVQEIVPTRVVMRSSL